MMELDALLSDDSLWRADDQRVAWSFDAWVSQLTAPPEVAQVVRCTLEALEDRWAVDGGLLRRAVVDVAGDHPVRLLVASMAWGFGRLPYGPARTSKMLRSPGLSQHLDDIASKARRSPSEGFSALFSDGRPVITGLNIAMGTKLLYFAARRSWEKIPAPPLVLDQSVYEALVAAAGGDSRISKPIPNPRKRISGQDYARLMRDLAAVAERAGLLPDDVECALFQFATWNRRRLRLRRLSSDGV